MSHSFVKEIEKHYGITFPVEYLRFLEEAAGKSFSFTESAQFTEWEIRFSELNDRFVANNRNLVDDANPDPMKLIPFAWSVSSGNNYLLDYRRNPGMPSVVMMDHEEAIVREDAESETDSLEEAQALMEQNVREIAANFSQFAARLVEMQTYG